MVTVSEIINSNRVIESLVGKECKHPLTKYAEYFSGFEVKEYMSMGKDFFVLKIDESKVLKISNKRLEPDHGSRGFDAPMLEKGFVKNFGYVIQPLVDMDINNHDLMQFSELVNLMGYIFVDKGIGQIGCLNNKLVLVDYFAVIKDDFKW